MPTPSGQRLASYTGDRPEVVRMAPAVSGPILDIGCSAGAVGARLRAQFEVPVWGIEADQRLAAEATRSLDRVLVGDAAVLIDDPAIRDLEPHLVVMADVLEHMTDPSSFYSKATDLLAPGGWVLASLPNVAHWDTYANLLQGWWPERDRGIHDDTHLRFFAVDNVRSLLGSGPMEITDLRRVFRFVEHPHPINRHAHWVGTLGAASLIDRYAPSASRWWLGNLLTFQFLVLARKQPTG